MFEFTSRYYSIAEATLELGDGRTVAYKKRRFLPRGREMPLLVEVTVKQGDRIDTLAARTLNDPEQFWRIADANDAMDPLDLVSEPGRALRVAVPQVMEEV